MTPDSGSRCATSVNGKMSVGIEEIEVRVAVPGRLRETVIEAAAPRSGNLSDDAIEHLAVAFVLVETVVQVGSEKSAALRNAERQRAVNRTGRNRPRVGRRVLQHRDHVANRGWPQSRRAAGSARCRPPRKSCPARTSTPYTRVSHRPPCRRRQRAQIPTGFSARCGAALRPSRGRSSRSPAIPGRRPRRRRDRDRRANDPLPFR